MSEREQKSGGVGIAIGYGVVALLPMLYVLGIGPAALIAKTYPVNEGWIGFIYYPLGVLGEESSTIRGILAWYIQLWGG